MRVYEFLGLVNLGQALERRRRGDAQSHPFVAEYGLRAGPEGRVSGRWRALSRRVAAETHIRRLGKLGQHKVEKGVVTQLHRHLYPPV